LLVVETGGWFIQGCPLSQMSKPELKGAIYRVRKVGQEKPEDPYGISIKWNSKDPDYIGQFLKDSRPFVAEKALQVIADLGEDAVDALQSVLETSESPDARTKAVFALYRISTPGSLATLRKYITDKDPNVSIAASRCAGLYKDMLSVPQLSKSLSATDLGVRRQAATALGQIKSKEAVDALMQAASSPANDRFLEHAITYALVNIADSGKVKTALANSSPRVISTAITALDQMIGSPVKVSDVYPHLSSTNPDLQQRAFWIASHHREWASEIIRFLPTGLKSDSVNAAEERQLHDVMVAFATERPMQIFMANLFEDASQPRQLMILDAMLKSQVKQFPALWQNLIRKQLSSGSPELVSRSLQLVQMNQLKSMDGAVLSVANNEQNPASIRLQALLSLQSANKKLNGRQFEFVLSQVSDSSEAVLRQQSASVLEKFNLTTGQLQTVADKILPTADGYTLTRLVPVFRTGRSARIGLSLANTLRNSPALDGFSEENINTIFKSYPAEVKPAVDSLLVKLKQVHAGRLARLKEFETLVGSGNLDRGRILFFGKATCGNCHTVGPDGGSFGPDLTSIQRDRSSHDLLEAILYPSASFVREFETYVVKTSRGEHTGIIRQRSPSGLELAVGPQSSVRIPSSDITSIQLRETSMMPQGFDKILSKQEISDLLVFLIAQDQDPETDENILR
jgi:putative heme-binding domain-containing protein